MLFELHIKDFILIEEVKIKFTEGFNTITGETGAGKSMILGAIALVLGEQANKDMVRIGCDKAFVSANFFTRETINAYLEDNGFSIDPDVVSISREVQAKGKSISRINGQVATLSHLKAITRHLIDIHGQNDNQILLVREEQLNLLDQFGGERCQNLRAKTGQVYRELKTIETEISNLEEKAYDRQRQIDFLGFQIDEIEAAKLITGEDQALENEFKMLTHMETLMGLFEKSRGWFSGEYGDGAIATVSSLSSSFERIADYNSNLKDFSNRFKEIYFAMDDLSKDLMHYEDQLDNDSERLEFVEKRLDEINRIKAKYSCKSIDDIFVIEKSLKDEFEAFNNIEIMLDQKRRLHAETLVKYRSIAAELTNTRKRFAESFVKSLQVQLNELNMKETNFRIDLKDNEVPTATGMDEIDFMISTNIGQPYRQLKKVVSGGELSRIMLGIKIVLGQIDAMPTLFFDEIDAGISGITANVVGEKLSKLSKYSQVVCITHLPQIAVFSDHHLLISKEIVNETTQTVIRSIFNEAVELEIGRLVGGLEQTETTNIHAREMIEKAHLKKQAFN